MRARRLVFAVAVVLGVTAPPSGAATTPKGAVVARDGGAQLEAYVEDGNLCVRVTAQSGSEASSCGEATDGAVAVTREEAGRAPTRVGVAIDAAATTLEVRRAGVVLATAPTVAGEAYRGRRAGTVRFALLRLPDGTPEDGLRFRGLNASGSPVEVLATGDNALVAKGPRLLAGRHGAVRWVLAAQRRSALQSTVVDPDEEAVQSCVTTTPTVRDADDDDAECFSDRPEDGLAAVFGSGNAAQLTAVCAARFRLLHGAVDGTVTGVQVQLGDGRRVAARIAPLPGVAKTVFALDVPGGAAIRGLVVMRPGGAPPEAVAFQAPPLAVSCAIGDEGLDLGDALLGFESIFAGLPPVNAAGPVATIPGPPAVRIADGSGGSLCVALGDRPFTAISCGPVLASLADLLGTVDDFSHPRAFAVVVPARVAALRLTAKGRAPRTIPATVPEGYGGRYAGRIRLVASSIPNLDQFRKTELLDASGRVLSVDVDEGQSSLDALRLAAPRRVAGAPGRASIWENRVSAGGDSSSCYSLTRGPAPRVGERCQVTGDSHLAVFLDAPCSSHRLTVGVYVARGARVAAENDRGRSRALRLHGRFGVLTLPRGRGLRAVVVRRRGNRSRRVKIAAPSPGAQCGWHAATPPYGLD